MLWYIIPGVIIILAIAGLVFIVIQKFPALVLIDVTTIAKERDAQVKRNIIEKRAGRLYGGWMQRFRDIFDPVWERLRKLIASWQTRAVELEKKYRRIGADASTVSGASTDRQLQMVMKEAEALVRSGKIREAEAKYIEAVSINSKHVKAYEELGRLYVREKQWKEAEETFKFLLKLDPEDASVSANLGELNIAQDNYSKAQKYFADAVKLKPSNPKYLDLLIGAAIGAGDRRVARETFARLKEINPENQKLPELEQRIREMRIGVAPNKPT